MKSFRFTLFNLVLTLPILFLSCAGADDSGDISRSDGDGFYSTEADGGGSGQGQAGVVTAGEWNDLSNWDFWVSLLDSGDHSDKADYWSFYTKNRVSVLINNVDGLPVNNLSVVLKKGGETVWATRTDNFGKAELWVDLFLDYTQLDTSELVLEVDGNDVQQGVILYESGVNEIILNGSKSPASRLELAFVVDATGSMGDEIDFLKEDLQSVINTVGQNNPNLAIATSSVFYRDKTDQYLTRVSPFSEDLSTTLTFISKQEASGGGDYPEAVHSGLNAAINELQWSEDAVARILFLLLDAPPHYDQQIIDDIQLSITRAAEKGIKVIPISASGVDKNTEFLMRFLAMSTNGTYVFITNHSGVGGDHIEASVGQYEVELLNELMVRLIGQYSSDNPTL